MAILSREQVLQAVPRRETVEVPEWGGAVIIQELTVAQQEAIAKSSKAKGDADAGLKTFLEGVVEPEFEPGDYDALRERGAAGMTRVLARILALSGMTPEAQAEIMGKSVATPNSGS